ncbi:MAG: hypothetical protein ACI9B7_001726 [Oleispira sp.]|jgi:hypothetical protein
MKRRNFLSFSLLSVLALKVTNVSASLDIDGAEILPFDLSNQTLDLNKLLSFLNTLPVERLVTEGEWDLAQIFNHAAQSIEYSMDGYPQHKPALFKQTIGPLAFQAFAVWGKMTHALSENILGAPRVLAAQQPRQALLRLEQSITRFDKYLGALQPHFAYGKLNKQEYALAHVLHLNNHFEEIRLV